MVNKKNLYILLMILSIFSLYFAYIIEYIYHLIPCPLCVYQRFPYLIIIFITIIAIAQNKYESYNNYLLITITSSILLAAYHAGIERGIFELSGFCKPLISIKPDISLKEFAKLLYSQNIPLCNKPALVVFKISMTEWNLLLNIGLFIFFMRKDAKTIF